MIFMPQREREECRFRYVTDWKNGEKEREERGVAGSSRPDVKNVFPAAFRPTNTFFLLTHGWVFGSNPPCAENMTN